MTMVTSVLPKQTPRPIPAEPRPGRRLPSLAEQLSDNRARLSQALQMSLELEDVIGSFFDHANALVSFDSLSYRHPHENLEVSRGDKRVHSCDYRLNTPDGYLGDLTFSRGQRFSEAELEQIESLIGLLVYPLRNALRYREAIQTALTDPLTGAGNRIALDNALKRELQLAERYGQELSLLVLDIDHFKNTNDTWGHCAGDEILKAVAGTIDSVTRNTDLSFRYGGEEFVVLLTKTGAAGAEVIAERIRNFIERLAVPFHEQSLSATISIGVASYRSGQSANELFESADRALYRAKEGGRNRVVCAGEPSSAA